jgi:glycine C-acetyltransferase
VALQPLVSLRGLAVCRQIKPARDLLARHPICSCPRSYSTASAPIVDVLRQRARPYLFSNTLTPSIAAASLKVFEMLEGDASYVEKVRALTHRFRDRMTAAGFKVLGARDHPICPVLLGDARLASEIADAMLARGVYVIGFSFPVVPKGAARIRTQISAAHSEADVDFAVDAFIAVGREKGVIA